MVSADANHLFLKIHGDVQNMDSFVLCEDDYLEYSESHILMENFINFLYNDDKYLDAGSVTELIDMKNNRVPEKLIEQFWNCYQEHYHGEVSQLLE